MIDLPDLPVRMKHLKRDHRGYPVPWFVKWYGDRPDFRVIGDDKLIRAVQHRLCWVCGQAMGRYMSFVVGPMCAINRTSAEPPSHHECAVFSARRCPFLANPRMHRQEHKLPDERWVAGIQIARNPGVACVWTTRSYKPFNAAEAGGEPGTLFEMGPPTTVQWFREGEPATTEAIWHSIATGLPTLMELVRLDPDREGALAELRVRTKEVAKLIPAGDVHVGRVIEEHLTLAAA